MVKKGVASRYLETLGGAEAPPQPLRPRSNARINSGTLRNQKILKSSSTSHFRNLANSDIENLQLPGVTVDQEDVIGLQGRVRLMKLEDEKHNWMDMQRKNLAAYEYLCYVGACKEWIEEVTHMTLPPVVQIEDYLRNGIALAKVTQAVAPHLVKRIYEGPGLQFRHSENINYFFALVSELGMPDLFTFELTDLYEKKNIPRVIYTIHAIAYALYVEGVAPPMSNLVGKLEFSDEELARTQRGLDNLGVRMPNFSSMNKDIGMEEATPEPEYVEPEESEEEVMVRELCEANDNIEQLQAVCVGFLAREEFRKTKRELTEAEPSIVALQSVVRALGPRQKLVVQQGAVSRSSADVVKLQALLRGYLARKAFQKTLDRLSFAESQIVSLQSVARGNKTRSGVVEQTSSRDLGDVTTLQAIIRGSVVRRAISRTKGELHGCSDTISELQAVARGNSIRSELDTLHRQLEQEYESIATLQSAIRGSHVRSKTTSTSNHMLDMSSGVVDLQSLIRGWTVRQDVQAKRAALRAVDEDIAELQCAARGGLVRNVFHEKMAVLNTQHGAVCVLQSAARAGIVRSQLARFHERLDRASPSVTKLQTVIRGVLARFDYSLMMEEFLDEEPSIVMLQAACRGALVRTKHNDRMAHFHRNMDKVIKIQSYLRARTQGDAYKSLVSSPDPPLSTVKKFVHLLNDSDFDFEEEVTLEKQRKQVSDEVHKNEQLEQFIQNLDVKIALLVKNKITLDELIRTRNKGVAVPQIDNGDVFNLKALNKTSRHRLELYQGFFYLLQTRPLYLTRLFGRIASTPEKDMKNVETLTMNIFAHAQRRREEFFLLKLISRSAAAHIATLDASKNMVRDKHMWQRLFAALNRGAAPKKLLKSLLGSHVNAVVDQHMLDLESDPIAIYRSLINQEELASGRTSARDPNLPVDEAIQDPETRQTFIANLQRLRELTSEFLHTIESSVLQLPYHVRYVARECYRSVQKTFPNESEDRHLAVIGVVLVSLFVIPPIVAPDDYGVCESAIGPAQRRNLGEVAKMLAQIASLRLFSRENVYLQPLNDYIKQTQPRVRAMLKLVIDVCDPEQYYETSTTDDVTATKRPTLFLRTNDIFVIHNLVCREIETVAPDAKDPLREVVTDMGALPSSATEVLNMARFTEVKLDLNPIFAKGDDSESAYNTMLVETKRYLLYVIRVQTGASLLDILLAPVNQSHEDKYRAILTEEAIERRKRESEEQMTKSTSSSQSSRSLHRLCNSPSEHQFSQMSYRDLKLLSLEKVIELETLGKISRANNYQEIVNSIAQDIKTKKNRRLARHAELDSIALTLQGLSEKEAYLQLQLKNYNDYIEQAMSTLQTKKGKRKGLVLPFTKQYFHQRELQKSGKVPKFGSFVYSAQALLQKGILVELNGYQDKAQDKVMFTFSSDEVGVFTVEAAYGGIALPGATTTLTLDDLLSQQYNNQQLVSLFDDMVKMNTNLLLHFIFRKFYRDN
ncbi:Ras GTPase-activating-like protein IQG1 [Yarrowia sp. B02]|nr:Ras GTPase-activating-like protein IQG1 [Yarrowia sp. B02]